jgi:hypothetical protein
MTTINIPIFKNAVRIACNDKVEQFDVLFEALDSLKNDVPLHVLLKVIVGCGTKNAADLLNWLLIFVDGTIDGPENDCMEELHAADVVFDALCEHYPSIMEFAQKN